MDTQGRSNIDPADQWVLDPTTGTYQLRTEPDAASSPSVPGQAPWRDAGTRREPAGPARVPASRAAGPQAAGSRAAAHGRRARAAAPAAAGAPSRRKAKSRTARRKQILVWTAGVVGFLVVVTGVGGYLLYQHFNNNITTVDVGDAGSKNVTHTGPMNILVIGTDSRQGLGGKYGDAGSVGHADTTILFHVSADRSNATALSIPRDIVTGIPACPTRQKDGSVKTIPASPRHLTYPKFNESLGQDGRDPGCTMRLVREMTGIPVDHFMMVNFEAVKTLSTAVGGVDICLARPLVDPKSHLNLAKGPHKLQGEQALQFVRTRHALQNQSDLDRIKLQQDFLSAMIRKMKSGGTLTDPPKLFALANAATKALTVDSAIGSVSKLSGLAKDLSKVDTKHITFTTLPVKDNPDEKVHATVVVDETRAPQLFSLIKNDVSLTQVKKAPARPDPRLVGPKALPHNVRVIIYNGSGVTGAAQDTLTWLQNTQGADRTTNGGNAPAPAAKTTLTYAPNQADQARALAAMLHLPAAALKQGTVAAAPRANMTLTLGADFTGPGQPVGPPTAPPADIQRHQADNAACVK